MADLKQSEKDILEKMFVMQDGYVLDFTNAKFQGFILNKFDIDIYTDKYDQLGDSKANRLRAFWKIENNSMVGSLILELLDIWKTDKLINNITINSHEKNLYSECQKIGHRLSGTTLHDLSDEALEDFMIKDFPFSSFQALKIDKNIIDILIKRIEEVEKSIKNEATLSCIIMCGSILEGLLLGIARSEMSLFNQCKISPKNKGTGKVLPFNQWSLSNFIDVAHNLGLLGLDVKRYSHSLRDFRNFIHPYEQLSNDFHPDIDTAKISWQVLKAAISDLIKNGNK